MIAEARYRYCAAGRMCDGTAVQFSIDANEAVRTARKRWSTEN